MDEIKTPFISYRTIGTLESIYTCGNAKRTLEEVRALPSKKGVIYTSPLYTRDREIVRYSLEDSVRAEINQQKYKGKLRTTITAFGKNPRKAVREAMEVFQIGRRFARKTGNSIDLDLSQPLLASSHDANMSLLGYIARHLKKRKGRDPTLDECLKMFFEDQILRDRGAHDD